MAVDCPSGWQQHSGPTTPAGSRTLNADDTYTHVSYEWVLADNSTPPTCGCGQAATFNFGYGYNAGGEITVAPWGVGGAVAAGITGYTELSVNVGPDAFEYIGYKVVLKEKTESGTVTRSGGFSGGGLLNKLRFAWRFIRHGPAAIVPTLTYNAPTSTVERYTQAAWKVCKRPCG